MLSKNVFTFVFCSTKRGKKTIKKKFPVSDTHNRQLYLLTMKTETVSTRVRKVSPFDDVLRETNITDIVTYYLVIFQTL